METTETVPPSVVCDAGPVIHLDELGCLDLLHDFRRLLLPAVVRREIARHRPDALRRPGFSWRHVTARGPTPAALRVLARVLLLHDGEVEALRVAVEHPGAILLTDDAAARLAARGLDIRVHGTIGVLLRSLRRGKRSRNAVAVLLRGLPRRSTLHVRADLLNEFIRAVERSDSTIEPS